MNGFPLDTGKKLMGDLVNVLRPSDTFNVVVFASGTETWSSVSLPATRPNLSRALQFIGAKNGGGGTRLLGALQLAGSLPRQPGVSRSIVLFVTIEAEAEVFDYVRSQLENANFFAFGIGSSVNRLLIEGVARAGLGEPFIVTEPAEAAEAASRLRRYIESPVLTGIDLTFSGFEVYDVKPEIPDLFASRPIVVFGKWRGAAGEMGCQGRPVEGSTRRRLPSCLNARTSGMRPFGTCGRERGSRISPISGLPRHPPSASPIASLGLGYGLLTRYTFVHCRAQIVRRTTEGADDVDQPLPLPAGVWDRAVGMTSGMKTELM